MWLNQMIFIKYNTVGSHFVMTNLIKSAQI